MGYRGLKKTDRKLNIIRDKISFTVVNPINMGPEKNKFFSKKEYNPQFRYEGYRTDLDLLKNKLENIKTDNSVFGQILEQERLSIIKRILMLKNLGKEGFTEHSIDVYGKPSKELVEKAKKMLTIEENEKENALVSEEVISLLKDALNKYQFNDWVIVEEDMPAAAAVKASKKILCIKKDAFFSKEFIDRLIVHEIGTHVLRSENGRNQPFTIFWKGLPDYMATEEGLAVVNEELCGHLNQKIMRNYIGRVIAVDAGLKGSFYDVFKELSKYFIAETAFKLTMRAKRGISDTSKPGGLTKDYLYLEGYFKVKKYLEEGGDIDKLYYGKIGVEHIPLLKDIPWLKKPVYLRP